MYSHLTETSKRILFLLQLRLFTMSGTVWILLFLQVLFMIFSLNGVSSGSMSLSGVNILTATYTADSVIAVTIIWTFSIAVMLNQRHIAKIDAAFVQNHRVRQGANMSLLVLFALIGAVTSNLSVFILGLYTVIFHSAEIETFMSVPILLTSILTTFLLALFAGALAYTIMGLLRSKFAPFILIGGVIVAALFSLLFFPNIGSVLFTFFFGETSVILFTLKIGVVTVGLFICAYFSTKHTEVM
ncbi:hypothetical protein FLK61_33650 [Paenalkalicoccus suaedae]|uniref:Uncharacterized protein n=1 Tax=Paenalkalicoccus suaedae TaxID=2592382 RepID=A0A859FE51_9BACI|nr:hypothetical protein [Paenalkalicoccus suaedae]QKS71633.1 hypothetical protein FLK61_33650 [Paenalkalicoccus suaedae]